MKLTRFVMVVGLAMLVTSLAYGEEPQWGDQAELSFVDTTGNTRMTTLSAKNTLLVPISSQLKATWKSVALYGKADGERNAESYATDLRFDYLFSPVLYGFGNGGWEKNNFAGLEQRLYLGAGLGYLFLSGPVHELRGEAGLIYAREKYTDDSERNFPGGRLYGFYGFHFSEKNLLSQSLEWLSDFDQTENYLLNSETALTTALNSNLSLKTAYVVRYDHQPPAGLDDTDTILGVTLVVNF